MLPKAESACFAIADISGYTHFVSGVELDHAQDIIADIMDTLVRALRPPFRLAKFEGDAAFVYALADKVDGPLMQDSIEQAYFAFRKRLRNIKQANSCECQACSRMQSLDVKFVVHHGEFIRQKMSGREELAGRDVILVHRLLKNDVGRTFGPRAYALYSDACVRAMGIDPAAQGLVEHAEAIEHIGETKCWVSDLEQAWTRESDTKRTELHRAGAFGVIETDFAAPRQAVWELVTMPGNRPSWQGSDSVVENVAKGRRGAGTQNHCMHGKEAIVEDILDWRPFDYVTLHHAVAGPGRSKSPHGLRLRRARRRRHAFRGALRQTETERRAVPRAHLAGGPSEVRRAARDPARVAGGAGEGARGRRGAASARLARTLPDPAPARALARAAGNGRSGSI
jgi:hypothetical protein